VTFVYVLLALAAVGALAYAVYQVTVRQQRILAEINRLEQLTAEVTMSAEALLDEIDERMARLNDLAAELEIRAVAEVQAKARAKAQTGAQALDEGRPRAQAQAQTEALEEGRARVLTQAQAGEQEQVRRQAGTPAQAQTKKPTHEKPQQDEARAQRMSEPEPAAEPEPASQKPKRGRRTRTESQTTAVEAPQAQTPADRYGDLRQAVWRLADEGKTAVEIAEALGVPRGEVLLMLNLRGKKAR